MRVAPYSTVQSSTSSAQRGVHPGQGRWYYGVLGGGRVSTVHSVLILGMLLD